MVVSLVGQLGEFLHKAIDIVPAKILMMFFVVFDDTEVLIKSINPLHEILN